MSYLNMYTFDNLTWKDDREFFTDTASGNDWVMEGGILIEGTPSGSKKKITSIKAYKGIAAIGATEEDARARCATSGGPLSPEWELVHVLELNNDWKEVV